MPKLSHYFIAATLSVSLSACSSSQISGSPVTTAVPAGVAATSSFTAPPRPIVQTAPTMAAPTAQPTDGSMPSQIALLLPLHGTFKDQSEAVLNGFLAAYYQLPKNQQPHLRIYDTTTPGTSLKDIYSQAVSDGAQFILGPLTKEDVQTLANNGSCSVPTVFLNYTDSDDQLPTNCFEFGISPAAEAQQAANLIWENHLDHAVIISPNNDWGHTVADSFKTQWQTAGGRLVAELDFDPQQPLSKQISMLMGLDQSNQRAKKLQRLLLQDIKFTPRRRADIGVIFMNATAAQAHQIVPLLKFNFAGSIPIVSTSLVYNGMPHPNTDRDLNGVRFPVMSWLIRPTSDQRTLYDQFNQLWPSNFQNNSKLYGIGMDGLLLAQQLSALQSAPTLAINGATGKLTLQTNQKISQQMLWARFVNGQPVLLSSPR